MPFQHNQKPFQALLTSGVIVRYYSMSLPPIPLTDTGDRGHRHGGILEWPREILISCDDHFQPLGVYLLGSVV